MPKGIKLLSSVSTQPTQVSTYDNLLSKQTWEEILGVAHPRNLTPVSTTTVLPGTVCSTVFRPQKKTVCSVQFDSLTRPLFSLCRLGARNSQPARQSADMHATDEGICIKKSVSFDESVFTWLKYTLVYQNQWRIFNTETVKGGYTPPVNSQTRVEAKHARGRRSHVPQPDSISTMTRWQAARNPCRVHTHRSFFFRARC